jgi:hypothetical protein
MPWRISTTYATVIPNPTAQKYVALTHRGTFCWQTVATSPGRMAATKTQSP